MLSNDVCRCWDGGCSERSDCLRWLARLDPGVTNHCASLKPYDEPIGDPCTLRIPAQKKTPVGTSKPGRRRG